MTDVDAAATRSEVPLAVAALVFITLLWGVSFPLVKMTNLQMKASQLRAMATDLAHEAAYKHDLDLQAAAMTIMLRFGLSFLVLMLCFSRQFRGLTLRHWLMGGSVGLVFAVAVLGQIIALNDISASRSAFLTSLTVVFTPLMMVALTRRRPALNVILAVIVALVGVAVLTQTVLIDVERGDALTILAAALFAAEIIMIDVYSRHMPPGLLTPGMFLAIFVTGTAVFFAHQLSWAEAPPLASWSVLFETPGFPLLGVFICLACTLVPFHLMNKYQAKVTPNQAALIYSLEPVFTTIWACFLPGLLCPLLNVAYESEALNWELVVGGGLVIAANVLGFWTPTQTNKKPD